MNPDQAAPLESDLGPYCLRYSKEMREKTTILGTGRRKVKTDRVG